ncbi:dTMP kinase [Mycoplasma phocoenae]|uniref:Thymidylate kinase n=1 Tax=Mycoplasma phocoenae TaxID=754517 RepID=A0A858U234_9MOLU|nr:dTMP kinase [Mycoplasma phocoenae]QJG67204.1 dTMP kinase [Mycoplasma phocoenae]
MTNCNKAKFITFEGMDGSGKTTIVKMLEEYIEKNMDKSAFMFTREPGGRKSKEAEKIRAIILDSENKLSSMVEALLFVASRRINLEENIWPALNANKIVISDRYYHSSLIYQGVLGGVGIGKVRDLNMMVTENTKPDLVIFFDLKPEISLERISKNRASFDRMESTDISYYQKLHNGYNNLISYEPEKFVVVDASKTINEVFEDVLTIFKNKVF